MLDLASILATSTATFLYLDLKGKCVETGPICVEQWHAYEGQWALMTIEYCDSQQYRWVGWDLYYCGISMVK